MRTEIQCKNDGASADIVPTYDRIEAQSKTAPAGNRGLTQTPNSEVRAVPQPIVPTAANQKLLLGWLEEDAERLTRATRGRIRDIFLARRHGLTNTQIGAALGITEGAVRMLMQRNPQERYN